MISVTNISTQAKQADGHNKYRFREEEDVRKAVREAVSKRKKKKPEYTGFRGIPELNPDRKSIADNMLRQQYLYNKTKGIRVREEMLSISEDEVFGAGNETVNRIADEFSNYFYNRGFQTAYGVYPYDDERGRGYDILYTINTVSFRDGSKYIRNSSEYQEEVTRAAKTAICDVLGKEVDDRDYFDMSTLEYYGC